VVGYGEVRRSDMTGSVVSLRGRASGVEVTTNESENKSGSAVPVPLGEHPLYVVDGKPVSPEEARKLLSEGPGEINVMRSTNATSIYGSRGSDGAVLITTRDALQNGFAMPDSVTARFETGIALKDWNPEAPYLDSLRAAKPEERYTVYLRLKQSYRSTPSC
jgi:hypothetical protein